MGKKLKLGFAMGGGVSLGTFSGAALTEAIKQAIVFAQDKKGNAFSEIEIDVFAGASAGAMSLGIMLRGFIDPYSIYGGTAADIKLKLEKQFREEYTNLSPGKREALEYAQMVQDIQEIIWTKKIEIEHLVPDSDPDLATEAGILQNSAVTNIAREYFKNLPDTSKKKVLADRVIFGATLSNLTPFCHNAKEHFAIKETKGKYDDVLLSALNDGMVSFGHREIRVFDLFFKSLSREEAENEPQRWCRYHTGPKIEGTALVGSINDALCWSSVAATVVASGAFPFAFEPVALTRSRREFGSVWPSALKDKESFPFTYVDGGTFNNEPIREAFRLAAYIDSEDNSDNYERRIIFVDPNVSDINVSYNLPVYKKYKPDSPKIKENRTRDKLMAKVASMSNAFVNEARTIEGDKILDTREKFGIRRDLRKALCKLKDTEVPVYSADENITSLHRIIHYYLQPLTANYKRDEMLPLSRHDLSDALMQLKKDTFFAPLVKDRETVNEFLRKVENKEDLPHTGWWYAALMHIYLDLGMGLYGKDENTYLLPIGPFKFSNDTNPNEHDISGKVWDLPGGGMEGFAGFASDEAGEFEIKFARYCASMYMKHLKLIPYSAATGTPAPEKQLTFKEISKDKKFLKRMDALYDRIKRIAANESDLVNVSIRFLLFMKKLLNVITNKYKGEEVEIRIEVPSDRYRLDNRKLRDRDVEPVKIDGKYYLVAFAWYDAEGEVAGDRWSGDHVEDGKLLVEKERRFLMGEKDFCAINMPDEKQFKSLSLLPDPVLYYEVKETDEGNYNLPKDEWQTSNYGIVPLEERILEL